MAVSGLDIWDRSNTNCDAHLFRKRALQKYASCASTQHNNERLVKLGAQMASTGKIEIMASIFAIALNDFMQEYHEQDDTHQEAANQPMVVPPAVAPVAPAEAEVPAQEEEDGGPKRRKCGNNRGKKKLFDLEQVVTEKEVLLAAVARTLGPNEYKTRCKRIDTSLKSKEENLREISGKEKSKKMMLEIDEKHAPNARQQKQGEDLPPCLLGYFLYQRMGLKVNVTQLGVTKKLERLKGSKLLCFEHTVNEDLRRRGYQSHPGLKLPVKIQLIKQDTKEKEEHTGGEYNVDISKFFKLVSTNVDKTIFDD